MATHFEWIVLVEVTDETGTSTIELESVERLVDALDDANISALYHPDRYAIQLSVDAPTAAEAAASAVQRLSEAVGVAGLPHWDLARVEVLSTEEYARELGRDERGPPSGEVQPSIDLRAAARTDDLLARALRDSLTGLETTELFRDRLSDALAAGGEAADEHHYLLVIDLDGFAYLNRSRGYAAGDQVLTVLAERLGHAAGPDAEVARIGGDRFAIFLTQRDYDAVERFALRILDAVAARVRLANGDVSVSASIGIAKAAGRDVDGLLYDASVAMCAAKREGGGRRQWFLPGLTADVSRLALDIVPPPDRLSCLLLVQRAAIAANEEADLAGAAQVILQQVCTHAGWVAGLFTDLEPGADGEPVDPGWHATTPERYRGTRAALDHRRPGDTGNLRTRVQADGEAAWLTDLTARSSAWAREATSAGIGAAYCFPVFVGNEVVGTLEFFSPRAVKPDSALLDVMRSVGFSLGRAAERRRARDALAQSASDYRALADCVPVLLWRSDAAGKLDFVNQRWLEFTGRALDDELGDGWEQDVHSDDLAVYLDTYRNALEQRDSFEMTYRLRRADGQFRWVLGRGSPVGTGHEFRGYVGGAVDVTERVDAEQALRRSEARHLALLDHAGAVTMVLDAEGRVVEEHLGTISLGYPVGHSEGRIGFGYLHPDDLARAAEAFVEVLRRPGAHPSMECRVEAADGTWRVMEAVANNQLHNPDVDGIIITSVEMTERKRIELALVESELQLNQALELAQVGTWRHDIVTGDDSCSEELRRMLGCEPSWWAPTGSLDLEGTIHPDDRPRFRASVDELTAPGDVRDGVFRIVRPDGEERLLHGRTTALGVDGRITATLGTFQDITGGPQAGRSSAPQTVALHGPQL